MFSTTNWWVPFLGLVVARSDWRTPFSPSVIVRAKWQKRLVGLIPINSSHSTFHGIHLMNLCNFCNAALCNFVGGGGMIAISSLYALFDKQIKIPWNPDSRGKFSIKFLCYCLTVTVWWRTVCFRTWKPLGTFWLLFSIGLCFPVAFVNEIVGPIRGFCLYYKTQYKAFGTSSFILMDSRAIWRYSIKGFSSPPIRIRNMWNYGRKNE